MKSESLKQQIIDKLLNNYLPAPYHCPFCGSNNIAGDSIEIGEGGALQEVHCEDCHKTWTDNYSITSVGFNDEDIEELLKKAADLSRVCPVCGLNPNFEQPEAQQKDEQDYIDEHGVCSACMTEYTDNVNETKTIEKHLKKPEDKIA